MYFTSLADVISLFLVFVRRSKNNATKRNPPHTWRLNLISNMEGETIAVDVERRRGGGVDKVAVVTGGSGSVGTAVVFSLMRSLTCEWTVYIAAREEVRAAEAMRGVAVKYLTGKERNGSPPLLRVCFR